MDNKDKKEKELDSEQEKPQEDSAPKKRRSLSKGKQPTPEPSEPEVVEKKGFLSGLFDFGLEYRQPLPGDTSEPILALGAGHQWQKHPDFADLSEMIGDLLGLLLSIPNMPEDLARKLTVAWSPLVYAASRMIGGGLVTDLLYAIGVTVAIKYAASGAMESADQILKEALAANGIVQAQAINPA